MEYTILDYCDKLDLCCRRSKTKNFLSIHSASRWRGGGRRREKNARKFFGFCTRESASVSEAHWFASPRNRGVRCSFKPPRAPRVRLVSSRIVLEKSSDFVQETQPKNRIAVSAKMRSVAKRRDGGFRQNSPRVFEMEMKRAGREAGVYDEYIIQNKVLRANHEAIIISNI